MSAAKLPVEKPSVSLATLQKIFALLLLCSAGLLLLIVKQKAGPKLSYAPQHIQLTSVETEIFDPLSDSSLDLPIPFGARAKSSCMANCAQLKEAQSICIRKCSRLGVLTFASQIGTPPPPPEQLARETLNRCESKQIASSNSFNQSQLTAMGEALNYIKSTQTEMFIYETRPARKRFSAARKLYLGLQTSPSLDPETRQMISSVGSTLCMRQVLAASQMAILQAANRSDIYSELYYRDYENQLIRLLEKLYPKLNTPSTAASSGLASSMEKK